jgi:signal transduction histidine kinase
MAVSYFQDLTLSNRLRVLQRVVPLAIALVAVLHQLVVARYIHHTFGSEFHYVVEIVFYGTSGPLVIWFTLRVVRRWVEQKEEAEAEVVRLNADLQRRVDERTRELREKNQALSIANHRLKELDRLKSEFVSLVSHELRAPLTNLHGALELMESDCSLLNPTCGATLMILKAQSGRLERLVEEVLTISRIEAGGLTLKRDVVDLVSVTSKVVDEFVLSHTRRNIHRHYSVDHVHLWADADRLYQVISNLVDNALKYSPEDAEIVVTVESKGQEGIASISDNGPGIPLDEQEHIFDKFHRLDGGDSKATYGYGLGLYFCRHLIEAMSGRIWIESDHTSGATFRVALPLAEG